MKKYILSLKHTHKTDSFFTLWRPNNAGYCVSLEAAGLYTEIKNGYHDSDCSMPIDIEVAKRMASTILYDGELKDMIPQNIYSLAELGIKRTRKGLIRIAYQKVQQVT